MKNICVFNKSVFFQSRHLFLLLLSVFFFFSCNNLFNSGEKNNTGLYDGTEIVFTGKLPQLSEEGSKLATIEISSFATYKNTNAYTFYVKVNGSVADATFENDFSSFNVTLRGTGNFAIEVFIKENSSGVDLFSAKDTVALSSGRPPVFSCSFSLAPIQTADGTGEIDLEISGYNEITYATIELLDKEESKISKWKTAFSSDSVLIGLNANSNKFRIHADSISSGLYITRINFYNNSSDKDIFYSELQPIRVYDGQITKKWENISSGASNSAISSGKFTVTEDIVKNFISTTFYVDPKKGSDANGGSQHGKFKTIQKALDNLLISVGKEVAGENGTYTIYLCDNVELDAGLDIDVSSVSKAFNVLLMSDPNSNTQYEIKAKNNLSSPLVSFKGSSIGKPFFCLYDLKITGNKNVSSDSLGGGVYVEKTSLMVSECEISGNSAKEGGGIYIADDALVILDSNAVITQNDSSEIDGSIGGGVCNYGMLQFRSGAEGLVISSNKSKSKGGGVYVADGADFSMESGSVESNSSETGGGIYLGNVTNNNGYFSLSGGQISANTATTSGGGIYVSGGAKFCISNNAKVISSTSKNDIYLDVDSSGKVNPILIQNSLNEGINNIHVPDGKWVRGTEVCKADGSYEIKSNDLSKIKFTDSDWNPNQTLYIKNNSPGQGDPLTEGSCISSDKKAVLMDAPIYVAGSDSSNSYIGTKSKPFATIERACGEFKDKNRTYLINIKSNLTGSQVIPATVGNTDDYAYKAASVVVQSESGTLNLNGNSSGTALKINTVTPVRLSYLKIYNGKNIGESDGKGGGVYIKSGAHVTLYQTEVSGNIARKGMGIYNEGTLIMMNNGHVKGNKIASSVTDSYQKFQVLGGGIYNAAGAKVIMKAASIIDTNVAQKKDDDNLGLGGGIYNLGSVYMSSSARIGSTKTINYVTADSSNLAYHGAGVYCKGNAQLLLGYTYDEAQNKAVEEAIDNNYGIKGNYAYRDGAGVYLESGTCVFKMNSGEIKCNVSATGSGGAIYNRCNNFLLSDKAYIHYEGTIGKNDINLTNSQTIKLSKNLSKNSTSDKIMLSLTLQDNFTSTSNFIQKESTQSEVTLSDAIKCFDFYCTNVLCNISSAGKLENKFSSSSSLAVGDIVFENGKHVSYTEGLTIPANWKDKAIAVIFYIGDGCNSSGETGSRTLGVGTLQGNPMAWNNPKSKINGTYVYETYYSGLVCEPNTAYTDYWNNSGSIDLNWSSSGDGYHEFNGFLSTCPNLNGKTCLAYLKNTSGYNETYFPPVKWANGYGNTTGNIINNDSYNNGWFIPTAAELVELGKAVDKVVPALKATGSSVCSSSTNSVYYGTISQRKSLGTNYKDRFLRVGIKYSDDYNLSYMSVCGYEKKQDSYSGLNYVAVHEF